MEGSTIRYVAPMYAEWTAAVTETEFALHALIRFDVVVDVNTR